jgi:hypothetical protein
MKPSGNPEWRTQCQLNVESVPCFLSTKLPAYLLLFHSNLAQNEPSRQPWPRDRQKLLFCRFFVNKEQVTKSTLDLLEGGCVKKTCWNLFQSTAAKNCFNVSSTLQSPWTENVWREKTVSNWCTHIIQTCVLVCMYENAAVEDLRVPAKVPIYIGTYRNNFSTCVQSVLQ